MSRLRTRAALLMALGVVLLAAPIAPAGAVVSATPDSGVETNGAVNATTSSADRVFLGGQFTRAGVPTGGGADLSLTDGARNPAFARPAGDVNAVVSDGAGGWYIGGAFSRVGALTRNNVAHLLANGSVDPAFDPNLDGQVFALVLSGGTLYVGGSFATVNGATARNNLAAFNASTGIATAFNPNVGGLVSALLASGSTLYAGGTFTTVNGATARNNLAAFDTTSATATSFNPNVNAAVSALAVAGGILYAGGSFTTVNGSATRNRIAAFDPATGTATSFDPNVSTSGSTVTSLLVSGSTLYAGGSFTRVNGTTKLRQRVAAFDTTTGTATTFDPDISTTDSTVSALALVGTTLYVAGDFSDVSVNTATRHRLAAFDTNTGSCADNGEGQPPLQPCLVTGFNPDLDGAAFALAAAGTRIYVGGDFQFANADTIHNGLVSMKPDGTVDTTFAPVLASGTTVRALAILGSVLYVGKADGLVAYDTTTGANIASFNASVSSPGVNALAVAGGKVYAGGGFTFTNGGTTARNRVAAFDATTGALDSFNPNLNNVASALAVSGGKLYAGGSFTVVNGATVAAGGTARNRIAAFDLGTGIVDPTFNPNVSAAVSALAISSGDLYAGGSFTVVNGATVAAGGTARNRIAGFDPSTGIVDAGFNPNLNNSVFALALSGSTLYAGGSFTSSAATSPATAARRLALFDTAGNGTPLAAFTSGLDNGQVNALTTSGTHLEVGGTFTSIGGNPVLRFAQFSEAAPPPVAPTAVSGDASAVTATSATVAGTVNPNGLTTAYVFEYGPSLSFGSITVPQSAGTGSGDLAVTRGLSGLTSHATYYYRLVATNTAGTTFGAVHSFMTGGTAVAPLATTLPVTASDTTSASLAGTVNPNGQQTAYTFEYGTSTSFGSITPVVALDGAIADESVSATLSGLTPHTTYFYRVVAVNATGTATGVVRSFTTDGTAVAPAVVTLPVTSTSSTSAALAGTVNPNGQQTSYTFEYGTSTSFGSITAVVALDSAIADEPVSATLTGLTPGTTYLYRVVATNATGTSAGVVRSFTTAAAAA